MLRQSSHWLCLAILLISYLHQIIPFTCCYCTWFPVSLLFQRPKPHLQMCSGTGPLSPATQGCSAAVCRVIRSPGSANQSHKKTKDVHQSTSGTKTLIYQNHMRIRLRKKKGNLCREAFGANQQAGGSCHQVFAQDHWLSIRWPGLK